MELDDHLVFLSGEMASLDIRAKVVSPSEATALTAPVQAGFFREAPPAPVAVLLYVLHQLLVLLWRPRPLLQPNRITTRGSPHVINHQTN